MTKTIEQLQVKNAELEKELLKTKLDLLTSYGESEELSGRIAELEADLEFQTNARIQDRKDAETNYKNWNAELKKQLAAEQLNNKRLREALEVLAKLGNGDRYGNSEGNVIAQQALSQPSDTSSLDSFVAEKVKEIIESHAPEGRNVTNAQHVEMRHKFVEQIATLTRQRVQELENQRDELLAAMTRCYKMLLSEPDTQGALFKAENILREAIADAN